MGSRWSERDHLAAARTPFRAEVAQGCQRKRQAAAVFESIYVCALRSAVIVYPSLDLVCLAPDLLYTPLQDCSIDI